MVAKKKKKKKGLQHVTCVKHAVSVTLTPSLTASATIWHFFQPTFASPLFIATLCVITRYFLDEHTIVVPVVEFLWVTMFARVYYGWSQKFSYVTKKFAKLEKSLILTQSVMLEWLFFNKKFEINFSVFDTFSYFV